MDRFQWIVWLGGGVLGWVAGEMAVTDTMILGWMVRGNACAVGCAQFSSRSPNNDVGMGPSPMVALAE